MIKEFTCGFCGGGAVGDDLKCVVCGHQFHTCGFRVVPDTSTWGRPVSETPSRYGSEDHYDRGGHWCIY